MRDRSRLGCDRDKADDAQAAVLSCPATSVQRRNWRRTRARSTRDSEPLSAPDIAGRVNLVRDRPHFAPPR